MRTGGPLGAGAHGGGVTRALSRRTLAVAAVAVVLVAALGVRALRSGCRWGTFVYTVGVLRPTSQEDRRKDAAVLTEGEEHVVTKDHSVLDVAISPDGGRVVVTKGVGEYTEVDSPDPEALYLYDLDRSHEQLLTDEVAGTTLVWSPDAEVVAFVVEGRSVWTVGLEEKAPREIVRLPPTREADPDYVSGLAWSGDSERLAYLVTRQRRDTELWTIESDGSERRRIGTVGDEDVADLAWSPDGERFAWSGSYEGVASVMTMSNRGGEPEQVEPNSGQPFWSRDGDRMAYVIGHEGRYAPRIVVGDGAGEGERAVPMDDGARWVGRLDGWVSC